MPTTKYLWDEENDSYLAETDETDALIAAYTVEPAHFGRVVSELRNDETNYHHYDTLGSTRQLTDESGDVTDTMIYDAWGNVVERTGATAVQFFWAGTWGYYFDFKTGLYQVRCRPFEPTTARWTTIDKLASLGMPNLYEYVFSSPMKYVDPSGLIGVFFDGAGQTTTSGSHISALWSRYCYTAYHYSTGIWPNNIHANISKAKERVCGAVCATAAELQDGRQLQFEVIDIFGWSRGAIAALTLAKSLNDDGCDCAGDPCGPIKPVNIRFLGLIDPVNTGGPQMIGTNSTFVPNNVRRTWIAEATKSSWVGAIFFGNDIPFHEYSTTVDSERFAVTHEQSGFAAAVLRSLEKAAKDAGVCFTP